MKNEELAFVADDVSLDVDFLINIYKMFEQDYWVIFDPKFQDEIDAFIDEGYIEGPCVMQNAEGDTLNTYRVTEEGVSFLIEVTCDFET